MSLTKKAEHKWDLVFPIEKLPYGGKPMTEIVHAFEGESAKYAIVWDCVYYEQSLSITEYTGMDDLARFVWSLTKDIIPAKGVEIFYVA